MAVSVLTVHDRADVQYVGWADRPTNKYVHTVAMEQLSFLNNIWNTILGWFGLQQWVHLEVQSIGGGIRAVYVSVDQIASSSGIQPNRIRNLANRKGLEAYFERIQGGNRVPQLAQNILAKANQFVELVRVPYKYSLAPKKLTDSTTDDEKDSLRELKGKFQKVCRFIELNRAKLTAIVHNCREQSLYLRKQFTGLPYTLQVEPEAVYIHCKADTYLIPKSNQTFKSVSLSIDYDSSNSMVNATSQITGKDEAEFNENEEMYEFEKECLERLRGCPNIAQLRLAHWYTAKQTKKQKNVPKIGFLMRYYQNGDLFGLLNKDEFTDERKRLITVGILRGMTEVHKAEIVYRDMKPENILLDDKFEPYIVDFGLSTHDDPDKDSTCGTDGYFAPELLVYELEEGYPRLNYPVDVYSTGVLLYEIWHKESDKPPGYKEQTKAGNYITRALDKEEQGKDDEVDALREKSTKLQKEALIKMQASYKEPKNKNTIQHLIWRMLRPTPEDRPTMKEALEKAKELLQI